MRRYGHAQARDIVHTAANRGLGGNTRLRTWAAVLWSAFLGAACSVVALLLVPQGWLDEPLTFGRLSALFLGAWVAAMVPALSVALLVAPLPRFIRNWDRHDPS